MKSILRQIIFPFAIAISMTGCGNRAYHGEDVVGAHEFVLDSYKIAQGKFSILEMEGDAYEELSAEDFLEYPDLIQEGDNLKLAFFHPTRSDLVSLIDAIDRKIGFRVNGGSITLPDISDVEIIGLDIKQAKEKIQNAYREKFNDVEVFLEFKNRPENMVQLAGMVQDSQVSVNGRSHLFDVLSQAGVPANANLFKSYMVRDTKALPVDMYKLVHEGDMSQNVVVRGGDKIFIAEPSASKIMLMGEVRKEGVIDIPNGYIPLKDALAKAGGILLTGNRAYIQVIRGNIVKPKIYTLNWRHVVRLPTKSLLLMPGDIVYVAATPIAQWNRLINQLIPSVSLYELFSKGIKGVFITDGPSS